MDWNMKYWPTVQFWTLWSVLGLWLSFMKFFSGFRWESFSYQRNLYLRVFLVFLLRCQGSNKDAEALPLQWITQAFVSCHNSALYQPVCSPVCMLPCFFHLCISLRCRLSSFGLWHHVSVSCLSAVQSLYRCVCLHAWPSLSTCLLSPYLSPCNLNWLFFFSRLDWPLGLFELPTAELPGHTKLPTCMYMQTKNTQRLIQSFVAFHLWPKP